MTVFHSPLFERHEMNVPFLSVIFVFAIFASLPFFPKHGMEQFSCEMCPLSTEQKHEILDNLNSFFSGSIAMQKFGTFNKIQISRIENVLILRLFRNRLKYRSGD